MQIIPSGFFIIIADGSTHAVDVYGRGVKDKLPNEIPIRELLTHNIMQCMAVCLQHTGCTSIAYNKLQHACRLYGQINNIVLQDAPGWKTCQANTPACHL